MRRLSSRLLFGIAVLVLIGSTEAWLGKKKEDVPAGAEVVAKTEEIKEKDDDDFLEEISFGYFRDNWQITRFVGTKVWKAIEKHTRVLRFIGIKLKEEQVVAGFIVVSNLFYCWLALLGFWFLPTNFMLILVLITLPIGPAAVLIFIGVIGAIVYFATQFPVVFVSCVWLSFFVKSRVFQNLGHKYELDIDGDGQIDVCDLLRHAAQEEWTGAKYYQMVYDLLKTTRTPSEQQIDKILIILRQIRNAHGLNTVYPDASTKNLMSNLSSMQANQSAAAAPEDLLQSFQGPLPSVNKLNDPVSGLASTAGAVQRSKQE